LNASYLIELGIEARHHASILSHVAEIGAGNVWFIDVASTLCVIINTTEGDRVYVDLEG
jgi:hypothetical protein